MWLTGEADGFRLWFPAVQGNGSLRTGLVAGDFTATVVDPTDAVTLVPVVAESAVKIGLYFIDITAAFLTANGDGDYGVVIEVDTFAGPSGAPNVRDAFAGTLKVIEGSIVAFTDRITDIWRIKGLDVANPLIVSTTTRLAGGAITQNITVAANTVTVQRV